ncbi:MAG: hypothetical protein PHH98_04650 [Candidatus Gracilibacteria bacterium]|nr:hypothetical protein [Candidatus Gracilibacteria bacterium]
MGEIFDSREIEIESLKYRVKGLINFDYEVWSRLQEYSNIFGNIILNEENILASGRIKKEEIEKYESTVHKILTLTDIEIVDLLSKNKPSIPGTNANIDSINRAFGVN